IDFKYHRLEPVTVNHPEETNLAIKAARDIVGHDAVTDRLKPTMGAEDFAYMLEARPGAYIYIGNGSTADVHNPAFDFNDEAIPYGIGYWVKLVETSMLAA
ncbi:MAG: amidohydrolase, partial [Mesorhizobium sp.]